MSAYLMPLLTGVICGVVFGLLKLPIPAPPALPGIIGIIGIWLGFSILGLIR